MTWQNRAAEAIKLTSPDGDVFEALWRGNEVSFDKKLAIFEYPRVKGTGVQDLGVTGTRYPLTILFEGSDNDTESARFLASCKQNGRWNIVHPVLGRLTLQLSTFRAAIDPVESGNLTVVITEWIDPIDIDALNGLTTAEIASQINVQSGQLNTTASDQFEQTVVQDKTSETTAVESTTTNVLNAVVSNLSILYESVAELNSQITAIIVDIQSTITQATIDTGALAGQIQNLIQLPALATEDIGQRLTIYSELISDILGLSPDGTTPEDKNIASVQEAAATACIVALSQIAATGLLKTRNQAIESADSISVQFVAITNGLDETQEAFIALDIDQQYFSQSSSFADAWKITNQAIAYLLVASFDLAIEKIITLTKPQTPLTITIEQYGTLGDADSNYDLFLQSNKLQGNDMLILQPGRQVVVYV